MPRASSFSFVSAFEAARAQFAANRDAICRQTLDDIGMELAFDETVDYVEGRDGSVTWLDPPGRFWGDCSVPVAASRAMLDKVNLIRPVVCLIAPRHAAQVRTLLCITGPDEAVVVVIPDPAHARRLLACDNFSGDIDAGRVFFLAGDWERAWRRLFEQEAGLTLPGQLVRLHDSPEPSDLSQRVHELIAQTMSQAQSRIEQSQLSESDPQGLLLVLPGNGRWDRPGLGDVRGASTRSSNLTRVIDLSDPRQRGPTLFALEAARSCGILLVDLTRKGIDRLIRPSTRVMTWCGGEVVPSAQGVSDHDRLLVESNDQAIEAKNLGWREDQIIQLPTVQLQSSGPIVIPNVPPLVDVPRPIAERSTVQLVWERIEYELSTRPFANRPAAYEYVRQVAIEEGVELDAVAWELIGQWLIPACLHKAVRTVMPQAVVAPRDRLGFDGLPKRAIVDLWPMTGTHPVRRLGVPTILAWCADQSQLTELRPSSGRAFVSIENLLDLYRSHE